MKTSFKSILSLAIAGTLTSGSFAQAQSKANQVERPPQFIMFAYDGSYNNEVWDGSREFTRLRDQEGKKIRFTYFINPVYLIHETNNRQVVQGPWAQETADGIKINSVNKNVYLPPHRVNTATSAYTGRVSDIGVGDNQKDVATRIEQMTDAHLEGHEIASHAVGHFDGSKWSETQWTNEFLQFNYILDNVFTLNKIAPSHRNQNGLLFKNDIVGFRAPVLGYNKSLFKVMKNFKFKYDTSLQDQMTYWPARAREGHWNYPLAILPIPGTGKSVTSMDYNFCVADTAYLVAKDPSLRKMRVYNERKKAHVTPNTGECINVISPEQKAEIKAKMLNVYRNYFNNNYYGNRAPMHIGHHFSSWMSGAYYEAFFEFANEVCGKPEVRCGTYKDLTAFMEKATTAEIIAYSRGQFPKATQTKWAKAMSFPARLDISAKLIQNGNMVTTQVTGEDAEAAASTEINLNGVVYKDLKSFDLQKASDLLDKENRNQLMFVVRNAKGKEIQSATHFLKVGADGKVQISSESLEERARAGHLVEAHAGERDDAATSADQTLGH